MTEKLTYDSTPADAPELNEEEQQSLEVAEKLGEEEAKQYAGKFENADELEKAYIELQKKLGSDEEPEKETEAETETDKPEEEEEPEQSAAATLIVEASQEWATNDGKLSEETMAKFSEVSNEDLVKSYMAMQNDPNQTSAAEDITDADLASLHESVGGEAKYNQMLNWAAENMDDTQLNAFNEIVRNSSIDAIKMSVAGMKAQYEASEGYEGTMLTGKGPKASSDVFRSQAELVAAMSDPRYEKDPAYQQDVYNKLERSNVQF